MILIVGLGNPGKKYEKTRHNLGFMVVDLLAERWRCDHYDTAFQGEMAKCTISGQKVMILKPQTFMNLSGASVAACAAFYKIATSDVWVMHDDLDLPLGKLRIREGGSAGGHNGVQSVIERLGGNGFFRFRMGVGRPEGPMPIEDYVLRPFETHEHQAAHDLVTRTADALEASLRETPTKAMNVYNA